MRVWLVARHVARVPLAEADSDPLWLAARAFFNMVLQCYYSESFHHARRQWNLVDDELLRYKFLNNFDRAVGGDARSRLPKHLPPLAHAHHTYFFYFSL